MNHDRLLLLGIQSVINLTEKRLQHLLSLYDSISDAVEDHFSKSTQTWAVDFRQKVIDQKLDIHSVGSNVFEKLESEKINFVTLLDPDYPIIHDRYSSKPLILFYKGNRELLEKKSQNEMNIGSVGSRLHSGYIEPAIKQSMKAFSHYSTPIRIVSGLAYGVDAFSHRYALENNLSCVAVIGTSLLEYEHYPKETMNIYHKILDMEGLILSSFMPGIVPMKHNFVIRNKLIAFISDALIVFQAGAHSGSMLTAKYTNEFAKPVYVPPGIPYDPHFEGNRMLLAQFGKLFLDANSIMGESPENAQYQPVKKELSLSREEAEVFDRLSFDPVNVEKLVELSKLPLSDLLRVLTLLEIKELVKNTGSNNWIRTE